MGAIVLRAVSHVYLNTTALDGVSFSLPEGCSLGLIGPDGVGKSTLLALIAGVKRLQQGEIQVLGCKLQLADEREVLLKRLAFMPQGLGKNLYPTLSVYDNIEFHARLFGLQATQREQRIQRVLHATGLSPFAQRAAGTLSGGMKQKLSLCCALVHHPDVLILDEPTTGVDPLSRQQFWQLIKALRAEKPTMTLLVATAYIEEAEQFDYILAMDEGKCLICAPTQQVLQQTQSPRLAQAYIQLLPPNKRPKCCTETFPPFVTSPNTPFVIEAEGLSKHFGSVVAVDNVSFHIAEGEIFGFLGSNGCGKTTTMKMLTGLLEASEGKATLLGNAVNADDINTRKQVGYMSQSFSLYEELSVYQNLALRAKLYDLTAKQRQYAIQHVLVQFQLTKVADHFPPQLSLGVRQRLQLAAACLHQPKILILDEPTSGVDPAARETFWHYLLQLSRQQKITLFISTHFMNEAQRCDRISFMHQGKVLAIGTPNALCQQYQVANLEQAFIEALRQQSVPQEDEITAYDAVPISTDTDDTQGVENNTPWITPVLTFALRESKEILRDRIRLFFAIFGPILLLFTGSWGLSFDTNRLTFTVLDQDQSYESRQLIEQFQHSAYFHPIDPLKVRSNLGEFLKMGKARLVIEIPPNFGKSLLQQRRPEVAFYIDGSMPFTGENMVAYVTQILWQYQKQLAQQQGIALSDPVKLEARFRYNQTFRSVNAISPGLIMVTLMLIPSMMTALAVVREREVGSLINFTSSPTSVLQYAFGKQIPYVLLAMLNYCMLVALTIWVIDVPMKGSFLAMTLGAFCLALAATSFGLLISAFVRSQVAAIFATSLISIIPTINFSGLLYPHSTLTGIAYWIGLSFPTSWYHLISLGVFTKGLRFASVFSLYGILLMFFAIYLSLTCWLLTKQEK